MIVGVKWRKKKKKRFKLIQSINVYYDRLYIVAIKTTQTMTIIEDSVMPPSGTLKFATPDKNSKTNVFWVTKWMTWLNRSFLASKKKLSVSILVFRTLKSIRFSSIYISYYCGNPSWLRIPGTVQYPKVHPWVPQLQEGRPYVPMYPVARNGYPFLYLTVLIPLRLSSTSGNPL